MGDSLPLRATAVPTSVALPDAPTALDNQSDAVEKTDMGPGSSEDCSRDLMQSEGLAFVFSFCVLLLSSPIIFLQL